MLLQKQSGLHDGAANEVMANGVVNGVDLNTLTYQENVLDTPLVITRPALYVYLNAMVSSDGLNDTCHVLKHLAYRTSAV